MIAQSLAHTLIVDDDREIRRTLRDLLTDEGYPVGEATDGLAALPVLREDPHPLVVLLDMMMPRMGGIELLRAVEADTDLGRKRAFLLVTANAHTLTPDQRSLLARLRVPIVQKPFDADELIELIEEARHRIEQE